MNFHQKRELIMSSIVRLRNLQKQLDRLIIYCNWALRTYPEPEWDFNRIRKGELITKIKHVNQNIDKIKKLLEGL